MKILKKLFVFFSSIGILLVVVSLYAFKSDHHLRDGYVPQTQRKNLKVLP